MHNWSIWGIFVGRCTHCPPSVPLSFHHWISTNCKMVLKTSAGKSVCSHYHEVHVIVYLLSFIFPYNYALDDSAACSHDANKEAPFIYAQTVQIDTYRGCIYPASISINALRLGKNWEKVFWNFKILNPTWFPCSVLINQMTNRSKTTHEYNKIRKIIMSCKRTDCTYAT